MLNDNIDLKDFIQFLETDIETQIIEYADIIKINDNTFLNIGFNTTKCSILDFFEEYQEHKVFIARHLFGLTKEKCGKCKKYLTNYSKMIGCDKLCWACISKRDSRCLFCSENLINKKFLCGECIQHQKTLMKDKELKKIFYSGCKNLSVFDAIEIFKIMNFG